MADSFNIVAVGIEDEGPVVVRVVGRTEAGGSVVAAAGIQPGPPERVYLSALSSPEGQVNRRGPKGRPVNPERYRRLNRFAGRSGRSEARQLVRLCYQFNIERRQCRNVECPASRDVLDSYADVVKQRCQLLKSLRRTIRCHNRRNNSFKSASPALVPQAAVAAKNLQL